ncbi:unnamed protein product, partial [Prorocentrum cordatum]
PGGSSGGRGGGSGGGGGAHPPPPLPHAGDGDSALARFKRGAEKVRSQLPPADANAATARGPVKWMPHTHANPRHAKFCFICLHGKLEGVKQQEAAEGEKANGASADDLPSPLEMQRLGYLSGGGPGARFVRALAGFERGNVVALWMRSVQDRLYDGLVRPMLQEHNVQLCLGSSAGLTFHGEEERDRDVLEGIFSATESEKADLQSRLEQLGLWCVSKEAGLLDVVPEPAPRRPLPKVDTPSKGQIEMMRYRPLLDTDMLKGISGKAVRETARDADAVASGTLLPSTRFPPPRPFPGSSILAVGPCLLAPPSPP